jgi:hypothetical protein
MKPLALRYILLSLLLLASCDFAVPSTSDDAPTREIRQVRSSDQQPIELVEKLHDGWMRVHLPTEGLDMDLPGMPIACTPVGTNPHVENRCYQSVQLEPDKALITVWANSMGGGIFEKDSIEAWFEGAADGLLIPPGNQFISEKSSTTFLGFPAQELKLNDEVNGTATVSRRLRFAVDGGEFVVSVAGADDSAAGEMIYSRIKDSIELSPIDYVPSSDGAIRESIVSVVPPSGWKQESGFNAAELVRFRNLTKIIVIKAAGQSSVRCTDYRRVVEQQFPTSDMDVPSFKATEVMTFSTTQPVPDFGLNLRVSHYCWDSRRGAVALEGVSEEQTFERWGRVFEGTAHSLNIH